MERQNSVILALTRAADQGVTATELKKLPGASDQIKKLKAEGAVRGPMKIGRASRYFIAEHAPKRDQIARRIEELVRDAGLKLTSLSYIVANCFHPFSSVRGPTLHHTVPSFHERSSGFIANASRGDTTDRRKV
jgi:hypothetical protein